MYRDGGEYLHDSISSRNTGRDLSRLTMQGSEPLIPSYAV